MSMAVLVLTIPCFRYIPEAYANTPVDVPPLGERLRPIRALDLKSMMAQLSRDIIYSETNEAADQTWAVLSVMSPYSILEHVMIMEMSCNRYLPGPEHPALTVEDGRRAFGMTAAVVHHLQQNPSCKSIHVGYNWSPRSWGLHEESTGFQSIPTKWHIHAWSWPQETAPVEMCEISDLAMNKRVFFEHPANLAVNRLIKSVLDSTLRNSVIRQQYFADFLISPSTLSCQLTQTLKSLLENPLFFEDFVRPLSKALCTDVFQKLTEAFTTLSYSTLDLILNQTSDRHLSTEEIEKLRETPVMLSEAAVRENLAAMGFDEALYSELHEFIASRCSYGSDEQTTLSDHCVEWKKGFGYALVFTEELGGPVSMMILPGVFNGPAGIVEAHRLILRRPLDAFLPDDVARLKSEALWKLGHTVRQERGKN